MPYEEANRWQKGDQQVGWYQESLRHAAQQKEVDETLRKVVKVETMPWESSPQGRIKHIMNERMDARFKTIDAYIQELPPAGRSGKHHHDAEEVLYVLEGRGYDLHWDPVVEVSDRYHWSWEPEPTRHEWEEGDCVYIPPKVIHQHHNADSGKPARFISATNRLYRALGWGDIEQVEDAPDYQPGG